MHIYSIDCAQQGAFEEMSLVYLYLGDVLHFTVARNFEFLNFLSLLFFIVEHCFEISVQTVRKLSAFERTSLGETDCFVQYNFPYQKPDADVDMSVDLSRGGKPFPAKYFTCMSCRCLCN